jgi:hypothetical protein
MLKFEIRNSIVDEKIVSEDDLELVSNFGVDTVKMREIEMHEKIKLKKIEEKLTLKEREKENMDEKRRIEEMQMQLKMKELELDFAREK